MPDYSDGTPDYPKLVRDRIPEICANKGDRETFRQVVDDDELGRLLDAKLDEELAEWRDGNDPAELADLLDVVHAVAIHHGIGWVGLQDLADAKREACGDLLGGVVWTGPEQEPDPDPTGYVEMMTALGRVVGVEPVSSAATEPDKVVDLMAALEQAVAAAKDARARRTQPAERREDG